MDKSLGETLRYVAFDFWDQHGAPNTNQYFWLRGGPWKTWLATLVYLYVVMVTGPKFMRNRKAFNLKWPIRIYNLVLVYINAYLFLHLMASYRLGIDVWGCGEALGLEGGKYLLVYGNLFFHTRYLEFLDTFFFILRKKESQISFLHVFHHGIVPTLMYVGLKFYPIPFNSLLPITNTFVHIVMYAYYGLATFPSVHRYLWWKKYLTTMQISQFALLLLHCSQALFLRGPTCKFPIGVVLINCFIGVTFLSLFLSFYAETYIKNKAAAAASFKHVSPKADGGDTIKTSTTSAIGTTSATISSNNNNTTSYTNSNSISSKNNKYD